jgi:hypothetical protein
MDVIDDDESNIRLTTAVVVNVTENACSVWSTDGVSSIRFASQFPAPRLDRVSPGHLVAVATAVDRRSAIVWRWFDAVILSSSDGTSVRLWEPRHGEISALETEHYQPRVAGTRAYISTGLRGSNWWVSGPVVDNPSHADVELDDVRALYDSNGMWSSAFDRHADLQPPQR